MECLPVTANVVDRWRVNYTCSLRLTETNVKRRACVCLNWQLGVKATRQDRVTVVRLCPGRMAHCVPGRLYKIDARNSYTLVFIVRTRSLVMTDLARRHACNDAIVPCVVSRVETAECMRRYYNAICVISPNYIHLGYSKFRLARNSLCLWETTHAHMR